jgi:hypothetical protein
VPTEDAPRESPRALRVVRAAQLRARVARRAVGQIALGSTFLVGALAFARAPDRSARGSVLWMTALLVLSVLDVGIGLRALARLGRRKAGRLWLAATAAWGLLSTLVVGFLLRG